MVCRFIGLACESTVQKYLERHKKIRAESPANLKEAFEQFSTPSLLPLRPRLVHYYGILDVLDDLIANEGHDSAAAWRLYQAHIDTLSQASFIDWIGAPSTPQHIASM